MVAKSYYNAAYFAESFKIFDDLRESGEQTCDIRLLASNKYIPAHKLILASASEYFKNAIYGLFLSELGKSELEVQDAEYESLSAIVNYIYTGKIEINSGNVYDIYNTADYCLMQYLKEMCLDFLQEHLDIENCVKIWIMANNSKHEKLSIASGNFIFSHLELISNTKGFLSLSNEEISDVFKLWPKDELFDLIITSILKWLAENDNQEETAMNILKNIPHTSVSEDYLENFLSKNKFIQNNSAFNKWMMNIYKDKLKSENEKLKLELAESEVKQKFNTFISEQPIIFMANKINNDLAFYKFNRRDSTFNLYNTLKHLNYLCSDCKTYKNWIYFLGDHSCGRFSLDDLNKNVYEYVFHHNHGKGFKAVVFNDSMYIFGGFSRERKGSNIDLNTKQNTPCSLLRKYNTPFVAVSDGSIYICCSSFTGKTLVERFDPREGRGTHFGTMDFMRAQDSWSAAVSSNHIYCTNGVECRKMDLRKNSTCVEMESPSGDLDLYRRAWLYSAYGKMYSNVSDHIYEYNNAFEKWQNIASFQELNLTCNVAATFE